MDSLCSSPEDLLLPGAEGTSRAVVGRSGLRGYSLALCHCLGGRSAALTSGIGLTQCKGREMISHHVWLKGGSRLRRLLWPDLKKDPGLPTPSAQLSGWCITGSRLKNMLKGDCVSNSCLHSVQPRAVRPDCCMQHSHIGNG